MNRARRIRFARRLASRSIGATLMFLAACVIILVACFAPRCTGQSPAGPRLGGIILIGGCR